MHPPYSLTGLTYVLFVAAVVLLAACEDKPKPLPIRLDIVPEDTTTHFNYGPAVSVLYGTLYEAAFVKQTGVTQEELEADTTPVEREVVLLLKRPLTITGGNKDAFEPDQTNVTQVQLVPAPGNARAYLNHRVKVTGKLWGAQTGHHFTPVVMETTTLQLNE
jgi:hypothetical protein